MRQDDVTSLEHGVGTESIRPARSARDFERARSLFVEYAGWLKVDLCFQDFERELATLPGAYAPPHGRLLLAGRSNAAFGCVALRPLDSACGCGEGAKLAERATGEVKRLYVQPARRGEGWGERLARAIVHEARAAGYRELKLDTLAWMAEARALYARLGFRECAPYYDNPLDGAVYMSLALSGGSTEKLP
ncbi:MAG TPA: GNAT family N-acetyltransferase [Casimicrobiaceae bacterium]|nr:GNAT family N-acetyltransferase [Casimicrobiaceae bacterium]